MLEEELGVFVWLKAQVLLLLFGLMIPSSPSSSSEELEAAKGAHVLIVSPHMQDLAGRVHTHGEPEIDQRRRLPRDTASCRRYELCDDQTTLQQ